MKNRQLFLSVLAVGLALGTAWAIRGRFGHEQGAAWAGAIGALSIILVAKRNDWYVKAIRVAFAAALGWGISGVMSYGMIVGYGRGTDFLNVFYGLSMLFVLGVLYGFLGGGFLGLALIDSRSYRVKWHAVISEMVALGLLVYAVLIDQLGWLMTPPRSEMWAACLGASIALAWHIARNQYHGVMKVAIWSALGAGFGFAFGNFLQVLGNVSGIAFNFWNVMEYSIGFFGGIGMAYGTFTSSWPVIDEHPKPSANLIPIVGVALFIPFVVWQQSFVTGRFDFIIKGGGTISTIFYFKAIALAAIIAVFALLLFGNYFRKADGHYSGYVKQFFIFYTLLYVFLSFLITGVFVHPTEQYLYVLNFILILFLFSRTSGNFNVYEYNAGKWITVALISVVIIAMLAFIAINSHEAMHGANVRFGSR